MYNIVRHNTDFTSEKSLKRKVKWLHEDIEVDAFEVLENPPHEYNVLSYWSHRVESILSVQLNLKRLASEESKLLHYTNLMCKAFYIQAYSEPGVEVELTFRKKIKTINRG